jgi:C1A family cysteine protease
MTTYNFVPARNRKYGWIPDRPDQRDKLYAAIQPSITVPDSVDLRKYCSYVEDQGKLMSCTGNACAGMLEILENKTSPSTQVPKPVSSWDRFLIAAGLKLPQATQYQGFQDVSRLFIYYNARVIDGLQNQDRGAVIRSALKSLNSIGYCWEKDWQYNWAKVNAKPPMGCYEDAKKRTIIEYHIMLTVSEMINCLAEGFPFVIGLSIFDRFESDYVRRTGIVNMPERSEASRGGHAVCVVGYNKKDSRFIVRNSWGALWGMDGYFTIPFDYVAGYGRDAWTIRR